MSMFEEVKNTANGAAIFKDWLGELGIVTATVAEDRAAICVGCDENREPNWWGRTKSVIADAMKEHLSFKNNFKLSVSVEEKLGVCRVCGCCNPLAVWVPPEHLKKHTTAETLEKFPSHCWKKNL